MKLNGDGTNIGKHLHVVNFGFTILEEDKACSAAGNHCLAVFKEPESYDSLKRCLSNLITEVGSLSSIEVDGTTFDVAYYLGGGGAGIGISGNGYWHRQRIIHLCLRMV